MRSDEVTKLIRLNPRISVRQMGEALHLTRPGAQYHMEKLKREGRLAWDKERREWTLPLDNREG